MAEESSSKTEWGGNKPQVISLRLEDEDHPDVSKTLSSEAKRSKPEANPCAFFIQSIHIIKNINAGSHIGSQIESKRFLALKPKYFFLQAQCLFIHPTELWLLVYVAIFILLYWSGGNDCTENDRVDKHCFSGIMCTIWPRKCTERVNREEFDFLLTLLMPVWWLIIK